MPAKKSKGVVQIGLIVVLVVLGIGVIAYNSISKRNIAQTPSPSPTQETTQEVTSPPTPAPTFTPGPKALPSTTPIFSAKPTSVPLSAPPTGTGYSKVTVATERGTFTISLVSIDMSGARMITDTASDGECGNDCPTLSLADYVARNGGFAGIHGTYSCPADYAECASKKNTFDFPVYNTRLGRWINGGNLFWNNRSMIFYNGSMGFSRNANSGGGGSAALVNYPGLVDGGNVIADQFAGFSEKQGIKGSKGGIGYRENVVYLVVASGVDMMDLAHIFKSLGATHALNLDGGGSIALWFGGYKAGPGRGLPNAIIFATK